MHNLVPLETNCIGRFTEIVRDKHEPRKTRLLVLRPNVNLRYQEYLTNFTSERIHQINIGVHSAEDQTDLLHCYASPTRSLNKLIRDIKEKQLLHLQATCQYCGINTDSTVDHYLPESIFPEFCVNAYNLFPCCPECNSNKSIFWYDPIINSREIINLYLDTLPTTQYLFLEISFVNSIPSAIFSLTNNGIPNTLFQIIDRHFFRLDLLRRYKEKFHSEYHVIYKAYKDNPVFLNNPNLIQQSLLHDAHQTLQYFGHNFWKGIIKQSLANNDQFLEFCSS